jgi:hypothetical protein
VEDTRVDVTIDDADDKDDKLAKKERPVWLVESTITQNVVLEVNFSPGNAHYLKLNFVFLQPDVTETIEITTTEKTKGQEDIMSVLLANEKKQGSFSGAATNQRQDGSGSDMSGDEDAARNLGMPTNLLTDGQHFIFMFVWIFKTLF